MKVERIKELAKRQDVTIRVFIDGKGGMGVSIPINRHNLYDNIQYFSDDYEFKANVEDEDDERVLTKLYIEGCFDDEEN